MMTEIVYAVVAAVLGGIGSLIGIYFGKEKSRKELDTLRITNESLEITNESLKLTNKKIQSEHDNLVIDQWKDLYKELKDDFTVLKGRYDQLEKELHDLQVTVRKNQSIIERQ